MKKLNQPTKKYFFKYKKLFVVTLCSDCGGDGLYKRHTSYLVKGKPVCFACMGSGEIVRKSPTYKRIYRVRTPNGEIKLVPAKERKFYAIIRVSQSENESNEGWNDEIPF